MFINKIVIKYYNPALLKINYRFLSSYSSYSFAEDYFFLKIIRIRKVGIVSNPHMRAPQNHKTPGGKALKNAPNLMNLGLRMQRTGGAG